MSVISVVWYLLAIIASCSSASPRILGGSSVIISKCPYQAQLITSDNHLCGAVIISKNALLTAAHCIEDSDAYTMTIYVGKSTLYGPDGYNYRVDEAIAHPNYNYKTKENDIAVLIIREGITFLRNVQAIKVALEEPEAGRVGFVSGWGRTSSGSGSVSDTLQYLPVTIIDVDKCDEEYGALGDISNGNYWICSKSPVGQGSCQGDSGGPLVVKNELVGLVSWGDGCGSGSPDVYTNVVNYSSWINSVLRKYNA